MCWMARAWTSVDNLCPARELPSTRVRQGRSEACEHAPGAEEVADLCPRRRVVHVELADALSRVVVLRCDRQVEGDDVKLAKGPESAVAVAKKPAAENGTVSLRGRAWMREGARRCEGARG